MTDQGRPLVLDATVVSNFASSDSLGWVADLVDDPVVASAVRDEIERGRAHGYDFLESALDVLGTEIPVVTVEPESEEPTSIEDLDAGERESLRVALARDGGLATDDMAARRAAADHDLPVTGSVGLLALGVRRGTVDVETANRWLATWRERRGYYAPVGDVRDVLDANEH